MTKEPRCKHFCDIVQCTRTEYFFVFTKIFERKIQKSRLRVVNENVDTHFFLWGGGTHVFREYLLETVFACSYGAQVQFFFFFKKYQKSRDTVPLKKGNIGIPVLVSQCSIFLEMNNAFNLFVFVNGTKVVYTAYGFLIVSCMVAMLT